MTNLNDLTQAATNKLTEDEALTLIANIASHFSFPGGGYFGTDDISQALDNIKHFKKYPKLTVQQMIELKESIYFSRWNESMGAEIVDTLELSLIEECENWINK